MLPGLDGIEVCRRLKSHPATSEIPVMFMSARTGTEDVVTAFEWAPPIACLAPVGLGPVPDACAGRRS
ncbi:hypothetical protein [Massilia sp. Se16.2.3]|uniref:hypothetical protein n=1 Tax=Massilia sp. Se16.2.3 TaxID=2709303 RepID=UPI001E64FCAB|nr:hypothetical protein [Massilia sp. Se16.2.3]